MRFCSKCGGPTKREVPEGDGRERDVCTACGMIHYQNPRIVAGCIIEDAGRILLCKRAIEPCYGDWTVPAGYLEIGESAMQGAVRETWEEARAKVEIVAPYAHFDIPHIGQVYLLYRARMRSPEFSAGPESLEVRWYDLDALPFEDLAFNAVKFCLKLYQEDAKAGAFHNHHATVSKDGRTYALRDHMPVRLA